MSGHPHGYLAPIKGASSVHSPCSPLSSVDDITSKASNRSRLLTTHKSIHSSDQFPNGGPPHPLPRLLHTTSTATAISSQTQSQVANDCQLCCPRDTRCCTARRRLMQVCGEVDRPNSLSIHSHRTACDLAAILHREDADGCFDQVSISTASLQAHIISQLQRCAVTNALNRAGGGPARCRSHVRNAR